MYRSAYMVIVRMSNVRSDKMQIFPIEERPNKQPIIPITIVKGVEIAISRVQLKKPNGRIAKVREISIITTRFRQKTLVYRLFFLRPLIQLRMLGDSIQIFLWNTLITFRNLIPKIIANVVT